MTNKETVIEFIDNVFNCGWIILRMDSFQRRMSGRME